MPAEQIEIAELVLRLPGVSKADAPALAERVLREVHDRLRGTGRTARLHLDELHLRLPAGLGVDELARRIADRITEVMR